MPINLESTLQGIRRGAAAPGVPGTLSDQIRAQKQKQQKQQFEMQRGIQELMMDQAATQSEMRRRAAKTAQEQRDTLNKRVLGVAQQMKTLAQNDPEAAAALAQRYPRVARMAGIDPMNPQFEKGGLEALTDRMFAQVEGKRPEQGERALPAPPGSPLHKELGLDPDVGQEIKYVGDAPYVNDDGEIVNAENITNFESLGVSKDKIEQMGGAQRAGGDLTKSDVIYPEAGDFPVPEGLEMATGPRDTLVSAATRIPGVNDFMKYLAGDPDYGEEERIARRVGDELENLTIMAFKPSEDDRTSNLQIELARKLAPRMGFLTTDDSVQTDLEVLHSRTEAKLEKKLSIANNEKFTEETRKTAEQRANQLGNLLSLTSPLLQASSDPRFVVENIIGTTVEKASAQDILEVLPRISDRQRTAFFESLYEKQREKIKKALTE